MGIKCICIRICVGESWYVFVCLSFSLSPRIKNAFVVFIIRYIHMGVGTFEPCTDSHFPIMRTVLWVCVASASACVVDVVVIFFFFSFLHFSLHVSSHASSKYTYSLVFLVFRFSVFILSFTIIWKVFFQPPFVLINALVHTPHKYAWEGLNTNTKRRTRRAEESAGEGKWRGGGGEWDPNRPKMRISNICFSQRFISSMMNTPVEKLKRWMKLNHAHKNRWIRRTIFIKFCILCTAHDSIGQAMPLTLAYQVDPHWTSTRMRVKESVYSCILSLRPCIQQTR